MGPAVGVQVECLLLVRNALSLRAALHPDASSEDQNPKVLKLSYVDPEAQRPAAERRNEGNQAPAGNCVWALRGHRLR